MVLLVTDEMLADGIESVMAYTFFLVTDFDGWVDVDLADPDRGLDSMTTFAEANAARTVATGTALDDWRNRAVVNYADCQHVLYQGRGLNPWDLLENDVFDNSCGNWTSGLGMDAFDIDSIQGNLANADQWATFQVPLDDDGNVDKGGWVDTEGRMVWIDNEVAQGQRRPSDERGLTDHLLGIPFAPAAFAHGALDVSVFSSVEALETTSSSNEFPSVEEATGRLETTDLSVEALETTGIVSNGWFDPPTTVVLRTATSRNTGSTAESGGPSVAFLSVEALETTGIAMAAEVTPVALAAPTVFDQDHHDGNLILVTARATYLPTPPPPGGVDTSLRPRHPVTGADLTLLFGAVFAVIGGAVLTGVSQRRRRENAE
jgi:hypothetical protein